MDNDSNLKGITEFIPQGSLFGERVDKSAGTYKRIDRKSYLWREAFDRCAKEWPKGKLTKAYFAIKTNHLKTEEDWAYLISVCNQEEKRGKDWCKVFWGSQKVIPTN